MKWKLLICNYIKKYLKIDFKFTSTVGWDNRRLTISVSPDLIAMCNGVFISKKIFFWIS